MSIPTSDPLRYCRDTAPNSCDSASHARRGRPARQAGLTLIELIIFIVILGIAVAGVVATYSTVVGKSADPAVRKQALAIADSLLLEIEQMAFTFCDSSDANFQTANSGGCKDNANNQNNPGPIPLGQTRGYFDNVNDYGKTGAWGVVGYNIGTAGDMTTGVPDITGSNIIPGYRAEVSITQHALVNALPGAAQGDALRIQVTVTGPGNLSVALVGYRARYAPNSP